MGALRLIGWMVWVWSVLVPVQAAEPLPAAARSLVLVVTPSGAGTGVAVGARGRVLVPWHVVRAHAYAAVTPSGADGRGPDPGRAFAARVVGVNRTRDLALLAPGKAAPGVPSIELRSKAVRPGALGRVLAGVASRWREVPVRVVGQRPGGSWHTGAGVVHTATVVTARAGRSAAFDGGLLLDEAGEAVGLVSRAAPGGLVTAIAVDDVLEFVRAAERLAP